MDHLKQAIRLEDTVLFLGSGISCWAGLPSWTELLEQLSDYLDSTGRDAALVRKEIDQDLLQAASYGFDQLTPAERGDFMRTACQFGTASPHEIHRKIVSLGPRCFITTNYDQLIEESLRRWQRSRPFRTVTNKQPFEEADIVQVRALDFVFKPHGDVGDIESIVLTREQYRKLLEGGEWKHALESLKTLLVTRRVIYLGFGLRDPDFLLLRDLLANTWKGGIRDHYAIMADIAAGEISFWRKNYGIHLLPYQTKEPRDGRRDHAQLLALLDELLDASAPPAVASPSMQWTSELTLALLRHANGLMRVERVTQEFPLRVHWIWPRDFQGSPYMFVRFDNVPVTKLLDEGPKRFVLIGLPGAGKTYALRQAAVRLAEQLHDACLIDPASGHFAIPIFVDMKLYGGDLLAMIEKSLPAGISLGDLTAQFHVKLFLDSFNEMPREQWDRGTYEIDLAVFFHRFPSVSVIIGSRTEDGLSKFELPAYTLDAIDEEFLKNELFTRGLVFSGRFERELRGLLQKPIYFQLVVSGSVQLPAEPHPRDLYQSFFANLSTGFVGRFGQPFDLERPLSDAAYDAINRGEEAQPVTVVVQALKKEMQSANIVGVAPEHVANWLVSKNVLLPYSGGRVAFLHQSITEFLAATELAARYRSSPQILKEKLTLTRWDQTLFLTLSLLPENEAEPFLDAVVQTDLALALNSVKYLECGRDEVVARLLAEIPNRIHTSYDTEVENALEFRVPISERHEPQLRTLLKGRDNIAACAAVRLLELKGAALKEELLQSILDCRFHWKYCTSVAQALRPFINHGDVPRIVAMAESLEAELSRDEDACGWFFGAARKLLAGIDLSTIAAALADRPNCLELSRARVRLLLDILWDRHTTEALQLASDLLMRGVDHAAFPIYMIAKYSSDHLSWDGFREAHVERLVRLTRSGQHGGWALRALKCACEVRKDLATVVQGHALSETGLRKVTLLYAVGADVGDTFFETLGELSKMTPETRAAQPSFLLPHMKLSWKGHEDLFIRLLRLRDRYLAVQLIDHVYDPPGEARIGKLELGGIDWWLDWLAEAKAQHDLFEDRLSGVLADLLTSESQEALLAEFNKKDSHYRKLLAHQILPKADWGLTTDHFSDDALLFLLNDLLEGKESDCFYGQLLGSTATASFVTERLIPLLTDAKEPIRRGLHAVLRAAGRRHGRRYLTT